MVVPVRESCAQVLGVASKFLHEDDIVQILYILSKLQSNPLWEVRHAGLLGIKYILAVRTDMAPTILPIIIDPIFEALKDQEDEVRAIAAESLIPVVDMFSKVLPTRIPQLSNYLWDSLLILDDLTVSTSAVMDLLAKLNSETEELVGTAIHLHDNERCMRKLCSFLRHPLTTVRVSTLRALMAILLKQQPKVSDVTVARIVRLLFQNFLLEDSEIVLKITDEVWNLFIGSYLVGIDQQRFEALITTMFTLLGWPFDLKFDIKLFDNEDMCREDGESRLVLPDTNVIPKSTLIHSRLVAAQAAGRLFPQLFHLRERVVATLLTFLKSFSCFKRCIGSMIFQTWMCTCRNTADYLSNIQNEMLTILHNEDELTKSIIFDESKPLLTKLKNECQALGNALLHCGLPSRLVVNLRDFDLKVATELCDLYETRLSSVPANRRKAAEKECLTRKKQIQSTMEKFLETQESLYICAMGALSSGFVLTGEIPDKLNPIIRALMNSLKVNSIVKQFLTSPSSYSRSLRKIMNFKLGLLRVWYSLYKNAKVETKLRRVVSSGMSVTWLDIGRSTRRNPWNSLTPRGFSR